MVPSAATAIALAPSSLPPHVRSHNRSAGGAELREEDVAVAVVPQDQHAGIVRRNGDADAGFLPAVQVVGRGSIGALPQERAVCPVLQKERIARRRLRSSAYRP